MDSDDEIVFHQMMKEETNLAFDDDENQHVLGVFLAVQEELNALPNAEGQGLDGRSIRIGTGQRDICWCSMIIFAEPDK